MADGPGAGYGYVLSLVAETDLSGVYMQNRQIGTDQLRSNFNPLSHTFTFTTNPNGTLAHTYTWRNIGATNGGWFEDEYNDRSAALQALSSGNYLDRVGGPEMVPFVRSSFDYLSNYQHANQWLLYNCKQEANNLITVAIWMRGIAGK